PWLRPSRGELRQLAPCDDGRRLISGSADGVVAVWRLDGADGLRRRIPGSGGEAWSLAVTPDGRSAFVGLQDGTVKKDEMASGEAVRYPVPNPSGVIAVAVAPDGRTFAAGMSDGRVLLWTAAGAAAGDPTVVHSHKGFVRAVVISADGQYLVSSGLDRRIIV